MRLLCYQGRRTAALAVYQSCATVLTEELGVEPEPDTVMLHEQIRAGKLDAPPHPSDDPRQPAPGMDAARQHNLPESLTPFFGREAELAQLRQRLEAGDARLITLTGPGGIGKTRLAVETARQNRHLFDHGAYFVALAGHKLPQELPAALVEAIGLTFAEGDVAPRDLLLRTLRNRRMLLILDNLEHLLTSPEPDAAGGDAVIDLILAILHRAPGVTLLVTSREQLNVQGEDLFRLRGLPAPLPDQLDRAGQYPAVRLFCERAYRRSKHFKLTPDNVASVVRICELTEGMPLGIELATTWLQDLGPEGVAAALEQDLSLLTTQDRDTPSQHRSMKAIFASSWRLLTPGEQRALGRLSVFRGGVSSRAAQQVAGASFLILTQLRYKSLLRSAGPGRYDMHPLLAQFAAVKLGKSGEADAISLRHSHYFLGWLSEYDGVWTDEALHQDVDNIREAWRVAVAHGKLADLDASLPALAGYYRLNGAFTEAGAVFAETLRAVEVMASNKKWDLDQDALTRFRLHLLAELTHARIRLARFDKAFQGAEEVVTLARALGDERMEAWGLLLMGRTLIQYGEAPQALDPLRRAADMGQRSGHLDMAGLAFRYLGGALMHVGEHEAGEAALREALAIQQALGNRSEEQAALLYLGVIKITHGDYSAGERYLAQALHLIEAMGNRPLEARVINAMGFVHGALGDLKGALGYHERSRDLSHELQDPYQESHAYHNLCTVNRKLGRLEKAEACGRRALALAQEYGTADPESYAWLHLGYVWLEQGVHSLAANAFRKSRDGWRAMDRDPMAMEAEAGLAAVALATGDLDEALQWATKVVEWSEREGIHGVDEPMQIAFTCYRAFDATGDPRARSLLERAYEKLMAKAARITDAASHRRFLTQIPVHRQIIEAWEEVAD